MEKVRTRFAPSPTGFMHIGNLRSVIFEYLIARSNNGDFVLRIEDTDQKRYVEGAVEFIYNTLNLCGINVDEGPLNGGPYGPYTQSERLPIYVEYAKKLVDMGKAYYCFCSEERLTLLRQDSEAKNIPFMYDGYCKNLTKEEIEQKVKNGEKYVIRQAMPKEGTSSFDDLVYGTISVENKLLEDQILLKSDGYPTYNFANVIDDYLMKINHVVRGNEYLSSTPKYNLLYEAFGWEKPKYIHLPHVVKTTGKKLSKREGDASFMDLYEKGFLPQAIVNYLVLLGWSPEDTQEIFTMEELIEKFNVSRISKSPSGYDIKKLEWVNSHYIKQLTPEELYKITIPHLEKAYGVTNQEWLKEITVLYQDELSYGEEIVERTKLFFNDNMVLDEEMTEFMTDSTIPNTLNIFKEEISNVKDWTIENINQCITNTKEKASIKGKLLYMPIRIKVTGQQHGPELPNTIHLLGKEKVIERLNK